MYKELGEQLRKPSGIFGKLVAKMMDRRNREFYEKIIIELELKRGDKIYEIGYGTGLGISLIASKNPDCTIHGIDFSELMVHKATKRNHKFINEGIVNLKYGNFVTTTFENEKYNKIFCVNVIYFWSDLNVIFRKIHSMLKKDGMYCIFMTSDKDITNHKFAEDFFKYPIGQVEETLLKAGFKSVEYKLDTGYYIKARK